VANDPLLSKMFGNELSCIEIKKNTEILMANDFLRGKLGPQTAVSRKEPVAVYSWQEGIIPFNYGGASSAVLRLRSVIDLRKSKKIDFSKTNNLDRDPKGGDLTEFFSVKLDERDLNRAEASLNSGKFCEALLVFENNYEALYYSVLAGVGEIKEVPKDTSKGISSMDLITLFEPPILRGVDQILKNEELYRVLKRDLVELDMLPKVSNKDMDRTEMKSILMSAHMYAHAEDWNAKKISVVTRLFNSSKLLTLPDGISNSEEFLEKLKEASKVRLANWARENQKDFNFSKKLWKHWYEQSISSFVSGK
jgi:hypothetical protein